MTDEQWDTLLPGMRTEILTRGESLIGNSVYTLSKEKFYELADKVLDSILNDSTPRGFIDIERMRQAVQEYDDAMAAKASMEG